jgi:hypothetical protein
MSGDHVEDEAAGTQVPHLAGALKAAASAAAMGAAVGAARAYTARRHDSEDADAEAGDEVGTAEPDTTDAAEASDLGQPDGAVPRDDGDVAPQGVNGRREDPDIGADGDVEPASRDDLRAIVDDARRLLRDLHGVEAESVSSVRRGRSGWTVGLEVVEVRRVPDSTDVLATYEVELDREGGVLRFERVRRYHRAEAGGGGRS